jgi:hypothetical protein
LTFGLLAKSVAAVQHLLWDYFSGFAVTCPAPARSRLTGDLPSTGLAQRGAMRQRGFDAIAKKRGRIQRLFWSLQVPLNLPLAAAFVAQLL